MRAWLDKGLIHIKFAYNPLLVQRVKTLPSRRWHPRERIWTAMLSNTVADRLRKWGFTIDTLLDKELKGNTAKVITCDLSGLDKDLSPEFSFRPYQKEGIARLMALKGRALLADDTGLGKTAQALGWLKLNPKARPAVIIAPATAKLIWFYEAQKLGINAVRILDGTAPQELQSYQGTTWILNYDIASHWVEELKKINPKAIIMDECHYIKNPKAQRTQAIRTLCHKADHIMAISATPATSRPIELHAAIALIKRELFPSRWKFAMRYCNGRHNGFGWDFNGASNTTELHDILVDTIMIRRTKKDVYTDLPEKTRALVPLECDLRKYKEIMREYFEWKRSNPSNPAQEMVRIEKAKRACANSKLKEAISWIANFLESGEKLLVFATHHDVIDALVQAFSGQCVVVDGRVSDKSKRRKAELMFQTEPKCRLFIGGIKAAGVALTLTAASNVAFVEMPWTPGDLTQAEDRVYGRINDPHGATIHFLLAHNTIEVDIARLLDKKAKVLEQILDGKDVEDESSILTEIIKGLEEE